MFVIHVQLSCAILFPSCHLRWFYDVCIIFFRAREREEKRATPGISVKLIILAKTFWGLTLILLLFFLIIFAIIIIIIIIFVSLL